MDEREVLAEVLDNATSSFGTGFWNYSERDHLVNAILAAGFTRVGVSDEGF